MDRGHCQLPNFGVTKDQHLRVSVGSLCVGDDDSDLGLCLVQQEVKTLKRQHLRSSEETEEAQVEHEGHTWAFQGQTQTC
jgi:hypothetical protein